MLSHHCWSNKYQSCFRAYLYSFIRTEVPVTDIEMKSFIEDGSALKNDALDNLEGSEIQQPKLDNETKQVRL